VFLSSFSIESMRNRFAELKRSIKERKDKVNNWVAQKIKGKVENKIKLSLQNKLKNNLDQLKESKENDEMKEMKEIFGDDCHIDTESVSKSQKDCKVNQENVNTNKGYFSKIYDTI